MSELESYPKRMESVAGQAVVEAEDLRVAMFLMGNQPAKMANYLALTTFEPEEFVSRTSLEQRVAALQGDTCGWVPSPQTLLNYCKESLLPVGFVEFGSVSGKVKNSEIPATRLTQKGRELGGIVAGALLSLELQSINELEAGTPDPPSLQDVMGRVFYKDGRLSGAPTRFAIYETLMQLSPGEGLALVELRRKLDLGHTTVLGAVQDLCNLNILCKEDNFNEKRRLTMSPDLLHANVSLLWANESMAVLAGMKELLKEGRTQVTNADIVARAQQIQPQLSRNKISRALNRWLAHPSHASHVQEVKITNNRRHHTQISVSEERRDYLAKLLNIRRLLTEDSEMGDSFRETAMQEAERIASSPQDIARLMRRAKSKTKGLTPEGTVYWMDDLASFIPPEGISMVELHRKVTERIGKDLVYRAFRDRVNRLQGMVIDITECAPERGRPGKPDGYVTLAGQFPGLAAASRSKVRVFPNNWADSAACSQVDPDLFYPIGGDNGVVTAATQAQADKAKAICQSCPVRLACLKVALDIGEKDAVRGGVWFKLRSQELSPKFIKNIQDTVKVEN
ncbi:MAG TPA: WhiB family transcriptional regulator [Candidatus Saccharimonadales bacterium]|nr:WhiB family transcriptional regulator [Candidatus Saccharimonadales bacterium]